MSVLCFLLSACVQKTDSSLVFSPDNFPDLAIKVNEGVDYVNDPDIQVTFTSSRSDIEFVSLVLGSSCAETDWTPAQEVISFLLTGEDGEKPISMKVKTQYGFMSKCVTKKLILDRAAPLTTDSVIVFSQAKLNSLTQSPKFSWAPAQDALSGISHYECSIGSTLNGFDVLPWTKLSNVSEVTALNLMLTNQGNYFPSLRAIDKAGNVGTPFGAQSWQTDMDPPTISSVLIPANGSFRESQTLGFKISWLENVVVTGSPQVALIIGSQTRYATYISGSGTRDLIFRYSVLATDNDNDGIGIVGLDLNGGKIEDEANNAATLATIYPSTAQVLVDNISPTVASVTKPTNGGYRATQNLIFTLQYSEVVKVTGTPRIPIVIGTTTRYAGYNSGNGTSTLTFQYTVQAGDNDSNGIAVNALELNSGTILDNAGNAAVSAFASPNTSSVFVDTIAPIINSVEVPASATYLSGQVMLFKVNFNEAVNVTGNERLALTIGTSIKYATYSSGSGTTQVRFSYTVASNDLDTDGIGISSAIDLNGGTVIDLAGNGPVTNFTVPNTSNIKVNVPLTDWTQNNLFIQSNWFLRSQDFDSSVWNNNASFGSIAVVTPSSTLAPDNTLTGSLISGAPNAQNTSRRGQVWSGTANTKYTFSIFIKKATSSQISYFLDYHGSLAQHTSVWGAGNEWPHITYNFDTDVVSTNTDGIASRTVLANNWVRIALSLKVLQAKSIITSGWGGIPTDTHYAWGAQLVIGETPGDYRKTTATGLKIDYLAPDSSLSAEKMTENSISAQHAFYQGNIPAGQHIATVYFKAAERTTAYISFLNSTDGAVTSFFDLTTGQVMSGSGTITSEGNGWYKCTLVRTSTVVDNVYFGPTSATGVTSYLGDGTSGLYFWNADVRAP